MRAVIRKAASPAAGQPSISPAESEDRRLRIAVVYTDPESTRTALEAVGGLAHNLNARIDLVAPQVVSYALPLESPPVAMRFNEDRFRAFASESGVAANVHIVLCRDRFDGLVSQLDRRVVVVVGGRKRRWPWLPDSGQRLVRRLRRAGYVALFKERE